MFERLNGLKRKIQRKIQPEEKTQTVRIGFMFRQPDGSYRPPPGQTLLFGEKGMPLIANTDELSPEELETKVINRTELSCKEKQKQLAIIEQISYSSPSFIPAVVEFWYEYDWLKTEDMETWMAKTTNELENYILNDELPEKINYKISHDNTKDAWIINKNGIVINEISYSRSKGMKYIVYLFKYYRKKTISDNDLRMIIDKWHGKSKKTAEVSTDAKKILQDLKYLFEKQCPVLAPVNDCIVISSKEPGCYFRTINNIYLEIFHEDIPDPIY